MFSRDKARTIAISILLIYTVFSVVGDVGIAYADSPTGSVGEGPVLMGTPEPDDGTVDPGKEGTVEPSPAPHLTQEVTIVTNTIREILFPYETLTETIVKAISAIIDDALSGVKAEISTLISKVLNNVLPKPGENEMFIDSRKKLWDVSIVIAGILMPLTLVINVGSALKEGASSVTGYAGAREALVTWFVGVGAAIVSYFLLNKGIELAMLAERAIMEQIIGHATQNIGQTILFLFINTGKIGGLPLPVQVVVGLFAILLILTLLGSIALALLAREVMIIMIVGIAPITIIAGTLGPLRWLTGIWMKVMVITLLLGPANFLLIGGAILIAQEAHTAGHFTDSLYGMLVAIGFVSVLIGLNGIVGKMVYGAAIEVAQKVGQGVMDVASVAAAVVGHSIAPGLGGLIGGFGKSGLATSGASGAGGDSGGLGGIAMPGEPGLSGGMKNVTNSMDQAGLTKTIGHALASTSNPITRGLGIGIAGGATNSGPNSQIPTPSFNQPLDTDKAVTDAEHTFDHSVAVGTGSRATKDFFKLNESTGVDTKRGLHELGYYNKGDDLQNSATHFASQQIRGFEKDMSSGYTGVSPQISPGPGHSIHDNKMALDIVKNWKEYPGIEVMGQIATAAHLRRTVLGEGPDSIITSARSVEDNLSASSWLRNTNDALARKEHSKASIFGKALGLDKT